jgi:hypothetical protein
MSLSKRAGKRYHDYGAKRNQGKILFTEFKINANCPIINIPLKELASQNRRYW